LLRLFASHQLLASGGALERLCVRLCRPGDHGVADGGSPQEVEVTLGERLGSGGTSDVYAVSSIDDFDGGGGGGGGGGGPPAEGDALKVARYTSARVASDFLSERTVLEALAACGAAAAGLVPWCVGHGERARDALHARAGAAADAAAWPVLFLRPRGEPLSAWVATAVAAAAAAAAVRGGAEAAAAVAAARRECATAVVLRVLDAVAAAHGKGWVHCDVRPSNIVVAPGAGGALLVDWGAACKRGDLNSRGVAAFADPRVLRERGVAANPHIDALAALFTWLAIAFGDGCAAPWLYERQFCEEAALGEARRGWIEQHWAPFSEAVAELEAMDGRSRSDAVALARACVEKTARADTARG